MSGDSWLFVAVRDLGYLALFVAALRGYCRVGLAVANWLIGPATRWYISEVVTRAVR